ncbi:MAG: lipid-A-disaccharide synthase N-terminal domain-containing protein [Candidatus Paceibacterota bacterium]|jgi:lipid-A-disaccharide synthase-like uncharacterized protein
MPHIFNKAEQLWVLFGFIAQFMFFSRFFIQWYYSEIHKKTVVPHSFWYLSIIGAGMTLVYAIHQHDPVFMIGYSFSIILYIRNLQIARKERESV